MTLRLGPSLLLFAAGCAANTAAVTRVADGVPYQGRVISAEAYSAYFRGAELEASGKLKGALRAYEDVLDEDSASASAWARIGSLRCRLARPPASGPGEAAPAFEAALERDPESTEAFLERARCAARAGQTRTALHDAEQASLLDPESEAVNLLVAELFESLGDKPRARAWLEARALRDDASPRLREKLSELRLASSPAGRSELDRALLLGELGAARRVASQARIPLSELALRASELGQQGFALETAERVLGSDPLDADAWVAALVASDLSGDASHFHALLEQNPKPERPLGPHARRLLAELLARRFGTAVSPALDLLPGAENARD